MKSENTSKITIKATVNVSVNKVWEVWTEPQHITKWNNASDDWHTPYAENDLRVGGKFLSRMEAKDGSFGFDFSGIYDEVKLFEVITYTLEDGRKVTTRFIDKENKTDILVIFDAEDTNSMEQQEDGWQSILNNFKKYTEQIITE
jgi:uncharacterized protein YndB with AHSA1/START domain